MSLNKLTADVLGVCPGIGTYDFLQKISAQLPQKMPHEVLKRIVQGLKDSDNNTRNLSKKIFMLLSGSTILAVVDSFFMEGADSLQDRDDMVHEALARLGDKASKINPESYITKQVHKITRKTISQYLADKENMPVHFTKNPADRRIIITTINEELLEKRTLTRAKMRGLIEELNKQTGLDSRELFMYLEYRNSLINMGDGCVDFTLAVEDNILKQDMRKALQDVLRELNPREKRVLEEKFGLMNGEECSLKQIGLEIGVTGGRVRQIEEKALRKLRHPSRSEKLKDWLF
jgi:RNA polymerase sigma factor (sigma-70 family)